MNAEFNWWLLIVGLVVGAGLVWFVLLDARRREVDVDDRERPREAAWLSRVLSDEGHDVSASAAERLLILHRTYLEAPPPDDPPIEPEPARVVGAERSSALDADASEVPDDDWVRAERAARQIDQ